MIPTKYKVSNSIIRNGKINGKAFDINENLKQLCIKKNLFLIDYTKTVKVRHLDKKKLHLHGTVSFNLGNYFIEVIPNISFSKALGSPSLRSENLWASLSAAKLLK